MYPLKRLIAGISDSRVRFALLTAIGTRLTTIPCETGALWMNPDSSILLVMMMTWDTLFSEAWLAFVLAQLLKDITASNWGIYDLHILRGLWPFWPQRLLRFGLWIQFCLFLLYHIVKLEFPFDTMNRGADASLEGVMSFPWRDLRAMSQAYAISFCLLLHWKLRLRLLSGCWEVTAWPAELLLVFHNHVIVLCRVLERCFDDGPVNISPLAPVDRPADLFKQSLAQ